MTFLDQRIIIKVIHSIQQEHLLNTQPEKKKKKKEKRNEKKTENSGETEHNHMKNMFPMSGITIVTDRIIEKHGNDDYIKQT